MKTYRGIVGTNVEKKISFFISLYSGKAKLALFKEKIKIKKIFSNLVASLKLITIFAP